jgi:SAM-dependent methyltransferase
VSRRKVLGAWYTPEALVDHVVSVALEGRRWSARRFRVLDPACGDGRFLAEVARRVASLDVSASSSSSVSTSTSRRSTPLVRRCPTRRSCTPTPSPATGGTSASTS